MDVSDGLAGDLAKLCAVSGVSADIKAAAIPLSEPAQLLFDCGAVDFATIVGGGDDYEILCAIPDSKIEDFMLVARRAGGRASVIGAIVTGSEAPRFVDRQGVPIALTRRSFSHF